MQRDARALVDGSVGGAIGTAVMSVSMMAGKQTGLMGEHPPELVAAAVLRAGNRSDVQKEKQHVLAVVGHFAFGIGGGALFGVLHRRLRLPISPVVHGALYATGIWSVSYFGWVPALGIMPSAEDDRPGRPLLMVTAHWIFGAVLGWWVGRTEIHLPGTPHRT
ncbi:MAG: hypothetical protein H0V86_13120 [Chloroflexia bacterium]|nr:hypothetical protein [Chloroflexia bacterium]